MATYKTAGLGTYTLAGSISSTATSITLSSFKVPITETDVTMSSLGTTTAYGTLSPGTNDAEFISFTGITQNANGTATLTGVTRGLNKETPYTTSSSFKRPHTGQALFILSNSPNVYDQYTAKVNDETITGTWTFPNDSTTPKLGSSYVAPTTQTQIASKGYVDSVAIAGAPDATTSVKGLVEIATQAEADARTATGGTGASLVATPALNRAVLTHDYAASSAGSDAYAITLTPAVTAYTTGDIYYFKADVANTGACTLNVNSLGAKTIKRPDGTDTLTGDILANQFIQTQYDGTNMVLLNPPASTILEDADGKYPALDGSNIISIVSLFGDGSDGDVTISSNTTLTSDKFYNNLTIDSTFTLNTGGYRIFVKGTLTNNGTIANNGSNGAAVTGGAGGAGVTVGAGKDGGTGHSPGSNGGGGGGGGGGVVWIAAKIIATEGTITATGGNGGNAVAPGGAGSGAGAAGVASSPTFISSGTSGAGGAGSGAGGAAAGVTATKTNSKFLFPVYTFTDIITGGTLFGGASGGGGGANVSGSIAGGGGGGMGGVIVEIYTALTTSGTRTVTGGTGGTGVNGGSSGGNGSSGTTIRVQI